jgi:hypothetical protein
MHWQKVAAGNATLLLKREYRRQPGVSQSDILDCYFDHMSFRLVSRSHDAIEAYG